LPHTKERRPLALSARYAPLVTGYSPAWSRTGASARASWNVIAAKHRRYACDSAMVRGGPASRQCAELPALHVQGAAREERTARPRPSRRRRACRSRFATKKMVSTALSAKAALPWWQTARLAPGTRRAARMDSACLHAIPGHSSVRAASTTTVAQRASPATPESAPSSRLRRMTCAREHRLSWTEAWLCQSIVIDQLGMHFGHRGHALIVKCCGQHAAFADEA